MSENVMVAEGILVSGQSVLSVASGVGESAVPILEDLGMYPLQGEEWYDQKTVLKLYQRLDENGFMNGVAIGMRIPDEAPWPPHIQTVHDALSSINEAYKMNHRNGLIGGYHYTQTGEQTGTMVCDNPYPSDMDYGLLYRTVQKFRDESSTRLMVIADEEAPSRKHGGESCTFHIAW